MTDKRYEKVRDNKNYMFAEFRSREEYKDAYKSVLDNARKGTQAELVIFIERLRTTMIEGK